MSLDQIIDTYCAAWSDKNAETRRTLLSSVWQDASTYTDPATHAENLLAFLDHIRSIRQRYPGARVFRTSEIDAHHDVARFTWRLEVPEGRNPIDGLDIAILNGNRDRIVRIIGFMGSLHVVPQRHANNG